VRYVGRLYHVIYGIWHQNSADISAQLNNDWNYFSCWKINIPTVWVWQSMAPFTLKFLN